MRFDALGANGNSIISTPNLDMMAEQGYNFENAYTAVPSCIPSRAALMTGLSQAHHGRVGYEDKIPWTYEKTLGSEFTNLGYQTEVIGKMHVYPERNRMGFEHVELHDGYLHAARKYDNPFGTQFENTDDYLSWFKEHKGNTVDLMDNGLDCNSWVARPWMYEEELHPTNWVVTKSIDFLKRHDPTVPFFLKMSFTRPHSPLDPPAYYFDMYMNLLKDMPEIHVGEWAKNIGLDEKYSTIATKGHYKKHELDRMRAGYYGAITHIDHQIGRFLIALKEHRMDKDTIILFLSDHGDQLGEHHLFRKAYPYQGSIHIPFIVYDPANILEGKKHKIAELVELQDVFPSLIDFATSSKVEGIDGMSVKPMLSDSAIKLRSYIHGEHSFGKDSSQYILTKDWKYIWFPVRGEEQLFHLKEDPHEKWDVSELEPNKTSKFRDILIHELKDREEGFVEDNHLVKLHETILSLSFLKNEGGVS
ncbi:arylsulfatase [Enterococcus saigonensis]|uniref:Arylsulfatase n=2 Tax=Enterococcus saigonensis TaxID=1805431 RepID=A0A679IL89_9ENTE|nr:arylsulfatase [Enterococcus saigonensis]